MSFLYFRPKSALKTSNRWLQHSRQNIISLLETCSQVEHLHQIHALIIRTGLLQDIFPLSRIIAFFTIPSVHFNIEYARRIFDQIHHPNLFIWNSMMRGYVESQYPDHAFPLHQQMLSRGFVADNYTYPILVKACCRLQLLETGRMLHGQILKCGFDSNTIVMSGLVHFYANFGRIEVARDVFGEMSERDVVSWTAMISGYVHNNYSKEALILYDQMQMEGVEPNKVTLMSLLSACGQLQDFNRGRWFHSYIVENKVECDLLLRNSLVKMYAKCGRVSNAVDVFKNMPTKNTVSWNVLIGGFSQSGLPKEAMEMFWEMDRSDAKPTEITVVSALSACAQLGDLGQGRLLDAYIKEHNIIQDIFVRNALINMYIKCGKFNEALHVFHEMPEKDVFSWTALIMGYVQENRFKEALSLFQEMQLSKVKPNEVTLVSLLSVCTQMGALDQGKWIHTYIEENNVRQDLCLGNALIDMYAKCGSIKSALSVFHSMPLKDVLSWNVVIGGLALHGHAAEAIDLFNQMERTAGIKPDHVTLTAVLCACTHSCMVQEGYNYFTSMSSLYDITPRIEHYGCVVDLLGRAGLLEEASEFIDKMPMEPNIVIWGSLLAACRVHHKVELGEKIAKNILELRPNEEGTHVLVSNIYAEAGRWDDAKRVRALMGGQGIEKSAGCSSIEVNGVVQEFFVRDATQT